MSSPMLGKVVKSVQQFYLRLLSRFIKIKTNNEQDSNKIKTNDQELLAC
jgi:hypothetical protein